MDQLWTPVELAEVCKVPLSTVRKWKATGTGPRALRIGRHLRYREADVIAWMEQAEQEPAATS